MFSYLTILLWVPVFIAAPKLVWYISTLNGARRFAESSPLPSVTVYTNRDSVIFWLLSPWLAPIIGSLPFGWGRWVHFIKKDYSWEDKGKLQRDQFGTDVYWLAQPGGLHMVIADAEVLSDVVHRWKDFPKPVEAYRELRVFGHNVVTAEGATWQRHRKITGPPFNERNSSLVFEETLRQGRAMVDSFTTDAAGNKPVAGQEPIVEDIIHWMMTVTLNVICGAAFNLRIAWPTHSVAVPNKQTEAASKSKSASSGQTSTHKMSFQHSIDTLANHLHFIIIFPAWFLRNVPYQYLRDMQQSAEDFVSYMREMISDNKKTIEMENKDQNEKPSSSFGKDATSTGKGDLLGNIIRASEADTKMALSDEETIGNIFIFILAGHETTAGALESALIRLATDPEIQIAVQDEIDSIWSSKRPGEDLTYEDYPKMRTIMSVMLETLRVYPPIVSLPKHTLEPQTITYRSQAIQVPANVSIDLDVESVQHNPLYWGPDATTFRTSRWLIPLDKPYKPSSQNTINESTAHENILCPQKGSFLAFSGGFRACLGKKFAQVEFCTLIAVLLREYSIELVKEGEETFEEMRRKTLERMEERKTILTMRMKYKVKVKFVRRGEESFPARV